MRAAASDVIPLARLQTSVFVSMPRRTPCLKPAERGSAIGQCFTAIREVYRSCAKKRSEILIIASQLSLSEVHNQDHPDRGQGGRL